MPGGDGTGPEGMGPMTGGGFGFCADPDAPGYTPVGLGRGYRAGWGRGMGWGRRGGWGRRAFGPRLGLRRGFAAPWRQPVEYGPPARDQEAQYLKQRAEWLQGELDAISQRVGELEREE